MGLKNEGVLISSKYGSSVYFAIQRIVSKALRTMYCIKKLGQTPIFKPNHN